MDKDTVNQVIQSYKEYYQSKGLSLDNILITSGLSIPDVKQWCKDNNYTYKVRVTPYRLIIISPMKG
jgi:mRNA-degrading endonuclease RelE of RelBE toxin-antitoxin system